MKLKRRSRGILMIIALAEIMAMIILYIAMDRVVSDTLKSKADADLTIIARDRAQLVETYIKGCTQYLDGYSNASEIKAVLADPDNSLLRKQAREYTIDYCKNIEFLEGLYVAKWDTFVLAHNNPDSVDKVFRDEKNAAILEEEIKTKGVPYCAGIVQAPVTRKMVIPVYAPVKDDKGEMIGFVGAAFYTNRLVGLLHELSSGEPADVNYSLLDVSTGRYIFAPTLSDMGEECTDEDILNAAVEVKVDYLLGNEYSYVRDDRVTSCYYMADRDWLFAVTDSYDNVTDMIRTARIVMVISFAIALLFVVGISLAAVFYFMGPIEELKEEGAL